MRFMCVCVFVCVSFGFDIGMEFYLMAKLFQNITAEELHRMTQHLQYRLVVPPTEGGGVTGAK